MSDATAPTRFRSATEETPLTRWLLVGLGAAGMAVLAYAKPH